MPASHIPRNSRMRGLDGSNGYEKERKKEAFCSICGELIAGRIRLFNEVLSRGLRALCQEQGREPE